MFRISTTLRVAIAAIVLLFASACQSTAQDYSGNASYQQFYDELAPYGEWINDPEYGYVWVPDAGDDFRPYYSNGYWVNTDYGNTWVSDYDWGWAPFHYGRWTYSRYYGWTWIPDNQWGPAWVSWRSGGGAYGWAPLGPGTSIDFSFGNSYYVPDYWWVFAPQQYILDRRFHRYTYGPRYNTDYIRRTSVLNYTYARNRDRYVTGPRRRDLEVATGRPVRTVAINSANRPNRTELRNDRLEIYRPNITQSRPRPSERPRRFQTAATPLPRNNREAADHENRSGGYRTPRERGENQAEDRAPVVRDRSNRNQGEDRTPVVRDRSNWNQGEDRAPVDRGRPARNQGDSRPDRQRDDRVGNPVNNDLPTRDVVTQPSRNDQGVQPKQNLDRNRNVDRAPAIQPEVPQRNDQRERRDQQQQMDSRRAEQAQREQQRAQQQQQMEVRRAEQAQQREQQRAQQQQQAEIRRAQESPRQRPQPVEQRIETPGVQPRKEVPATAPVREDRKPDGGGEGRSNFGGRRR